VVRRFLLIWVGIVIIAAIALVAQISNLENKGRSPEPLSGGSYSEAAIGSVQVVNPLLPDSASSDVDKLIFSGLTRYDAQGHLTGDLATAWDVSPDGKTYTFHLRKNVKWHDGVPFTATDVAFTIAAIQNPDSRSPLASSWQGVKVDTKGDYTVVFTIPTPLASFTDSTTIGIVPRHILEGVEPSQLREADFNQNPVGTGPFIMKSFAPAANEITLSANPNYYLGKPRLDSFTFRYYPSAHEGLLAYERSEVVSPGRIDAAQLSEAASDTTLAFYDSDLPEETTLFFQTTDNTLNDATLRKILSQSVDREALLKQAEGGEGRVVTQPLLPGQLGYTAKYALPSLSRDDAKKALDAAGWKADPKTGVRQKGADKLQFNLATLKGGELETTALALKSQWDAIGVKIDVIAVGQDELQQTYMRPRNFQMLLYGINLGADSDVYAYWHSTQAKDPGVNLSGYASADADKVLEAGRISSDPRVRTGKYDTFLKVWNGDAPAAVLFQTLYRYGAAKTVHGITAQRLITPADRFFDVQKWTVREKLVPRYH
jgi:peptide/nickel transport system substrate-binding protein